MFWDRWDHSLSLSFVLMKSAERPKTSTWPTAYHKTPGQGVAVLMGNSDQKTGLWWMLSWGELVTLIQLKAASRLCAQPSQGGCPGPPALWQLRTANGQGMARPLSCHMLTGFNPRSLLAFPPSELPQFPRTTLSPESTSCFHRNSRCSVLFAWCFLPPFLLSFPPSPVPILLSPFLLSF